MIVELENFEAMTNNLREQSITVANARDLFHHAIDALPVPEIFLCVNADVVQYPLFELAVVKFQICIIEAMSREDCTAFVAL